LEKISQNTKIRIEKIGQDQEYGGRCGGKAMKGSGRGKRYGLRLRYAEGWWRRRENPYCIKKELLGVDVTESWEKDTRARLCVEGKAWYGNSDHERRSGAGKNRFRWGSRVLGVVGTSLVNKKETGRSLPLYGKWIRGRIVEDSPNRVLGASKNVFLVVK